MEKVTTAQHEAYLRIHASEDFGTLRRRFRGWAFIATAAFMSWYLLYVLMSTFAADFMSTKLFGNINVALVFGLLQFVSTFGIAWMYAGYANRELDPIAGKLQRDYDSVAGR